jgi:uncharacterized protein (TIGR04255 family)
MPELKAQQIGIYWDRIRKKYPHCQQQSVVINPSDPQPFIQAPGEIFPLPRFWFLSDDHPTLLQVQRNAFMLNWRRFPSALRSEYPHYETMIKDFWQELEDYQAFIQEYIGRKLDPIQRCDVNLITPMKCLPT